MWLNPNPLSVRWPLTDGRTILVSFDPKTNKLYAAVEFYELRDRKCASCKQQIPACKRAVNRLSMLGTIDVKTPPRPHPANPSAPPARGGRKKKGAA
jgi:hypothetical protein